MKRNTYLLLSSFIFFSVLIFPFYQIFVTGGLLFYTNGWDEASYLQYDYAKHVLDIAGSGRLSQYVVVCMHELGLSGGYINLIFDTVITVILLSVFPALLSAFNISKEDSRSFTILLLGLPLVFSNFSPIYDAIQKFIMASSAVSWISLPYIRDPFWLRTPEPQITLILLTVGLYLFSKFKNILFLIPFTFISYPFIALPLTFIIITHYSSRPIINALILGLFLLMYKNLFLPDIMTGYIVDTRLPLISFSGLTLWIALLIAGKKDKFSLAFLFAIWFSLNFQVISGFTIQPNNFEQYFAAPALVFAVALSMKTESALKYASYFSVIIICLWSHSNFEANKSYLDKVDFTPELKESLKKDASKVALPDIYLSTRLDMLFPRQKPLLFSYTRFYKKLPDIFLPDFLCSIKQLSPAFQRLTEQAMEFYKNGDKNYILNTIGRVKHPLPEINLSSGLSSCEVREFKIRQNP